MARVPAVETTNVTTSQAASATIAANQAESAAQAGAPSRAIGPLLDARRWSRLCRTLDLVALCAGSAAAVLSDPALRTAASHWWLALVFPPLVLAVLHHRRGGNERLKGSLLEATARLLGAVTQAALILLAADALLGGSHSVALTLRLWAFCAACLALERLILSSIRSQAVRLPAFSAPTLVIGAGRVGDHLVTRLLSDPGYGLRPVGFLDSNPLPRRQRTAPLVPVLGGPDDLEQAIELTGARHVLLAFSNEPDQVMLERVRACERLGVTVSLVPRLFESINERAWLDHVGGVPVLTLRHVSPRGWQFAVKHAFDRLFAACTLVILAPLMALVALIVAVTSSGPVLFRQRRVGRDGQTFDLLKFRTMREAPAEVADTFEPPAGAAPGGVEGEDRCTPVGRWLRALALDELPQFVNVLRGEMSVVGPRPERPEFVERFVRDVSRYEDRHRVKSGITGWAQVHGLRGQTSIADRVEWDNYYIQNWSLSLDLQIVALTAKEVLRSAVRGLFT